MQAGGEKEFVGRMIKANTSELRIDEFTDEWQGESQCLH